MASAVQTVCGQAYGAKKHGAMSIIVQRAIILHIGAAVILSFLYRTIESKVMAIRICVGIRFPILSSMINYWAQSNIRVKIFACQNLHESSLLISGCLHRFPPYAEIQRKGYGRLYL